MQPSPQEQFLLEIARLSRDELARRSNALMDEAGREVDSARRAEICRQLLIIDAIAEFKFVGGFAAARRRAA